MASPLAHWPSVYTFTRIELSIKWWERRKKVSSADESHAPDAATDRWTDKLEENLMSMALAVVTIYFLSLSLPFFLSLEQAQKKDSSGQTAPVNGSRKSSR